MRIWVVPLLMGCALGQCPTTGWVGNLPSAVTNGDKEDGVAVVAWDPDGVGPAPELLVVAGISAPPENVIGLLLWDGESPQWIETDTNVQALAVHQGDLIALGAFTTIGGVAAPGAARFDGATWMPMGSALGAAIHVLEVVHGELYVGGEFSIAGGAPADHLARWDGLDWAPVGGGTDGPVEAIAGFAGDLVVGGAFDLAGGVAAPRIASWDGMSWSALGAPGWDGDVQAVVEFQGDLIAGGDFTTAGGSVGARRLAAWDGAAWRELGGGVDFTGCTGCVPSIRRLLVDGSELIVAGRRFNVVGGASADGGAAIWDGAAWAPSSTGGGGLFTSVQDLARWEADYVLVGELRTDSLRLGVALWDRSELRPVIDGLDGGVHALLEVGDDVVAAGDFNWGSGERLGGVGRFDGDRWHGFDGGVRGTTYALASFGGQLIVGGDFNETASGSPIAAVARWDGQSWLALGGGLERPRAAFEADVRTLLEYQGTLIAGGYLAAVGVPGTGLIAQWDGANWHALGDGFDASGPTRPRVDALAEFQGDLYATGTIRRTGGGVLLHHIARWDGMSWSPLGAGLAALGADLTTWNGNLVVCGNFTMAGGLSAPERMAFWDGASWSIPPASPIDLVRAVVSHQGELFAAGSGPAGSAVAAFDGMTWRDLTGDLVADTVEALESGSTYLRLGGHVYGAGGEPAGGFASYGPDCDCITLCGDCDASGAGPDVLDSLRAAQVAVGLVGSDFGCCDIDSSGAIDVLDSLRMAQGAAGIATALICP